MSSADSVAELAERLGAISEQISDLALDQLRQAAELEAADASGSGRDEALAMERRLLRARRAVDKAANLLQPRGEEPED